MAYIKYGIVTKIEIITNNKATKDYLNSNFNLNLYNKIKNEYYLNHEILKENIVSFRKEILKYTMGKGDSIDSYEAFYLNTTAEKLLKKEMYLFEDNEKYSFANEDYCFETDKVFVSDEHMQICLYLIAIFWDINRVEFENFITLSSFVGNLIKRSSTNVLKDASFLAVV